MAPAPPETFSMFGFLIESLGGGELLAVLVMLMVVVGPDRLPMVARKIGKGIAQARAMFDSMSDEVREVVDDPAMQPLREIGEFALRPRQKLSEIVRMAELDLTEESAAATAAIGAGTDAAALDPAPDEVTEPGEPPHDGPQHPLNIDDKMGDRNVPIDVEVAAEAEAAEAAKAEAEAAKDEDRAVAPDHVAFTTGALPLSADPQRPEAFAQRGRSLSALSTEADS